MEGQGSLFGMGQLTGVSETEDGWDRVLPPTPHALAQRRDRVREALMAERTGPGPGPPLGLPVGPNQERVLGLSSQTPFQCLCQAGRAKGQQWFGFIKKLCYIKN